MLAVRGVASAIIGTGSKFIPLPSGHAHSSNGQSYTSRILFVHGLFTPCACARGKAIGLSLSSSLSSLSSARISLDLEF